MYLKQLPIFKDLTPYSGQIDEQNRWIKIADLVPWDEMEEAYRSAFDPLKQAVMKPSRLILGLLLGQMLLSLSDREILEYFHENPYFQYFCGYDNFIAKIDSKRVCHDSLLSKQRKRLGKRYTDRFQAAVLEMLKKRGLVQGKKLMLDATVFPANISYPNDVKLLNTTREWACEMSLRIKNIIDPQSKVRTYRRVARRVYRGYCNVKRKNRAFIRKSTKQMIRFTRRNVAQLAQLIRRLETHCSDITHLGRTSLKGIKERLQTALTILAQQTERVTTRGRHIQDRIVSLHQPKVRPIVRGKDGKSVEFGPKAHIARVDGYAILDECQFDAFHEGIRLKDSLNKHTDRFGCAPDTLYADQLYANRANRSLLAEKDIEHNFKAIGRPPKHPDQCYKLQRAKTRKRQRERNHIEGLFGHLKENLRLQKILWTVPNGEIMQLQLGLAAFNLNKAILNA